MSGASRTLMPWRCACSTTSSTVRSSKSASARITSSGRTRSRTSGSSACPPSSRKPGTASGATTPTNSYARPPRARLERAAQAHEALARADEDDPAPDPRRAHHLERRRLVRSPEQPDRDRRDDHRRRDQPRGREVVARADPEREHDQRDDDEAREDPSGARTQLPPAVETRLREHEHRDRRGELEPLGRALAPEQAPEDVAVAGDDLANDEREVDPEREPDDVEGRRAPRRRARARRRRRSARARAGRGARLERHDPSPSCSAQGVTVSAGGATLPDIPWMLEPRHVVPRDVRARWERASSECVEVGGRARRARSRRTSAGALGDGDRGGPCRGSRRGRGRERRDDASARARSPSECVVGIARSVLPDGSSTTAGAASDAQRSPAGR